MSCSSICFNRMSNIKMQQVKLFSESVTNSCGRFVGASSSDIAEPDIDSSSTTGAKTKSELLKRSEKDQLLHLTY